MAKMFYRRHLPHFQLPGSTLFVTFRLHGSLPAQVIEQLRNDGETSDRQEKTAQDAASQMPDDRFTEWDDCLDKGMGPKWLAIPEIAQVVADALRYLDKRKYNLVAYCIMPNHVHVVFTPLPLDDAGQDYHSLSSIMQSLKGFTARKANHVLGRKGHFWQDESYDHVVRNEDELKRIVDYVLYNPAKAGLTDDFENWPWSYCKYDL